MADTGITLTPDWQKLLCILMSLPPRFNITVTILNTMEDLTAKKAITVLLERKKRTDEQKVSKEDRSIALTTNVKDGKDKNKKDKDKRDKFEGECYHCGKVS